MAAKIQTNIPFRGLSSRKYFGFDFELYVTIKIVFIFDAKKKIPIP